MSGWRREARAWAYRLRLEHPRVVDAVWAVLFMALLVLGSWEW